MSRHIQAWAEAPRLFSTALFRRCCRFCSCFVDYRLGGRGIRPKSDVSLDTQFYVSRELLDVSPCRNPPPIPVFAHISCAKRFMQHHATYLTTTECPSHPNRYITYACLAHEIPYPSPSLFSPGSSRGGSGVKEAQ